ncbi:MAG TPA: bifunctional DNA primase/polymerase [Nitrobacter sp.]|nr:bifunctional DNA primase/polymerase [Nitrobacter sp.]
MTTEVPPPADSASINLQWALFYVAKGWEVFPVPPGTKAGYSDLKVEITGRPWGASKDPAVVRSIFETHPEAWIGARTGAVSGMIAADIDTLNGHKYDGFASLEKLEAQHGKLPPTLRARSPSGSEHIIFDHPGFHVPCSVGTDKKGLAPGIDIKGDGGIIILPPSGDPEKGLRNWITPPDFPLADWPQWTIDWFRQQTSPVATQQPASTVQWERRYDLNAARELYQWLADNNVLSSDDDWRNAGMAAKYEFGEDGLELWQIVAHESLGRQAMSRWNSFAGEGQIKHGKPTTLDTIAQIASRAGWRGRLKSAEQMFSDVTDVVVAPPLAPEKPLKKLIQTSAEFVAGFVAPSYLLDGILQKQFCYSLTAATGAGKTAIALRLAAHVALGRKLGDRDVERGRVLYFATENYVDVQARWIAMSEHCGFDADAIDVHFVPGATKLSEIAARITDEAMAIGDLALVIVDTSAATFEGDDENGNVEQGLHARRMRSLTELQGRPTVLVLCHPVKNAATKESLVPRGGGAFIAEVDGNLCAQKGDSAVEVHWTGKFRGMDFAPLMFRLDTVTAQRLKDARGRNIPTVMAAPIDDFQRQAMAVTERSDQDQVLKAVEALPGASLNKLAEHLNWRMRDGKPYGVRVNRTIRKLANDGLVMKHRDEWILSSAGQKELNRMDLKTVERETPAVSLPLILPLPMTAKH